MVTDGLQFWECVKGIIFFEKCRQSLIGSHCHWNYVKMFCLDFSKHYHLIIWQGSFLAPIWHRSILSCLKKRKIVAKFKAPLVYSIVTSYRKYFVKIYFLIFFLNLTILCNLEEWLAFIIWKRVMDTGSTWRLSGEPNLSEKSIPTLPLRNPG